MATASDIKSNKNRIAALAEIRPDLDILLTAQYGGNDCMTYVFETHINGKTYQGIGPSKKKAKTMVCENVLIHLGLLDETTEAIPDRDDDSYIWEDFTSDIIDRNCRLFYDFDAVPIEVEEEVDPSMLKPLHEIKQEIQIRETAEWLQEVIPDVYSDEKFFMIGKNAVSILSELYPNAEYELIRQSNKTSNPCFVYGVYVNREEFVGSGVNKKLAKARAAREALKCICNMEFGVAEDGMPIYEGDTRIWQAYKQKIEEEAERQIFSESIKNPVTVLHEYFPMVKYDYEDEPSILENNAMIFVCCAEVENQVFKGSGLNKKAAKSNAAATALESLEADGTLMAKRQQIEEKKRDKEKTRAEKPRDIDGLKKFMSAVSKLDALFPLATYRLVGESNLKNTILTAFTMRLTLDDKHYIGVGKTKKAAKQEAAEKALKALGHWEESDERAKKWAVYEHTMSSYSPDSLAHLIRRNEAPGDLIQLIQEELTMSNHGRRGGRGRSSRSNLVDMEDMEMYLAEMLITLSGYFGWRGGFSNFDKGIYGRGPSLPGGVIPLMGEGGGMLPTLVDGGSGSVIPLLDEQTVKKIKGSQNPIEPRSIKERRRESIESPPPKRTKPEHHPVSTSIKPTVNKIISQPIVRPWRNITPNTTNNHGLNQQVPNAGLVRANMWQSNFDKQRLVQPNLQQINAQLSNSINNQQQPPPQQNPWNQSQNNMPTQQPAATDQPWTNINQNIQPTSAINPAWTNQTQQQWNPQWSNTNWNQWNGAWNNQMNNWNWQAEQQVQPAQPPSNQFSNMYGGAWPQ